MNISLNSKEVYGFPAPTEDPKKKDKAYIAQYGRALLSDFMRRGENQNWYHGRARIKENLAYATGTQGMDRYHGFFNKRADGKRKPWERLNLKELKIMPRYFRIVQDKLDQVQFDAICTPIDSLARQQKEEYASKLRFLMEHMDFLQSVGIDLSGAAADGVPEVPIDEDELQQQLDSWQNQEAVAMEIKLAKVLLIDNDWEQIDKELDDDVKYMGACLFRDYTANGNHYVKRIDPRNGIIPNSQYEDHRDMVHAGYLETITIAELRAEAAGDLTEKEIEQLSGYASRSHQSYILGKEHGDPNDSRQIEVFRFQFKAKNQYVAKKTKTGIVREKNFSYNPQRLEEGAEVSRIPYNAVYEGTIILNSELSYGCRMAYDQKRVQENPADCLLNIHAFIPNMVDGKSLPMAEEVQAAVDAVYRDWIGMHDDIAKATPEGYKYDFRLLENIALQQGGNNLSKKEIIDIHKATGDLYYYSVDAQGNQTQSQGVSRMDGGLPNDLERRIALMRHNISLIEQITGINDVTAGTNNNPEMGKAVSELKVEASISSLTHLFRCKRKRFEALCKSMAIRIRQGEKRKPVTGAFVKPGGKPVYIDRNDNLEKHIYHFKIENRPSAEEWQRFYQRAEIALANKEITIADMAAVEACDNLKQAMYILSSRTKRNEKMRKAEAMQNQQANIEGQTKSAQEAELAKQQTLQLTYQLKGAFQQQMDQNAQLLQQQRYDREMELEQVRTQNRTDVTVEKGNNEIKKEVVRGEIQAVTQPPEPTEPEPAA